MHTGMHCQNPHCFLGGLRQPPCLGNVIGLYTRQGAIDGWPHLSFLPPASMDLFRVGLRSGSANVTLAAMHYGPQAFRVALSAVATAVKYTMDFLREPWVANTIQVMLFSTCFEAARRAWQMISDKAFRSLFVEVRIDQADFAWDWVKDFLDANGVFANPTLYRLVAQGSSEESDGHPKAVFFGAPEEPAFWKWNGHWIKVALQPGKYDYRSG